MCTTHKPNQLMTITEYHIYVAATDMLTDDTAQETTHSPPTNTPFSWPVSTSTS